MNKFVKFLESLLTKENYPLIECIVDGYTACFEGISLIMRLATEEEAREFAAKHPEKNLGALRGIYVVTGKDNKPIVFAPNAEMATAMKQRMEMQANTINEKITSKAFLPSPPSAVMYQDEEEANLPPEIRGMEPESKEKFWKWFSEWQRYNKNMDDINKKLKMYKEKFPYFFEK